MAVNVDYQPDFYVSDGTLTPRSIKFPFASASDIVVSVNGFKVPQGTSWAVDGAYPNAMLVPRGGFARAGDKVLVERGSRRRQDYRVTGASLDRTQLENSLDRSVMIVQEVDKSVDDTRARAFMVPVGETVPNVPLRAVREGRIAAWVDGGLGAIDVLPGLTDATPIIMASRVLLAMLVLPVAGQPATLTEAGREGQFVFRLGNYAAAVANDAAQAVFVASVSVNPAIGCWVRASVGPVFASWFGVVADGESANPTDNTVAMQQLANFASFSQRHIIFAPDAIMFETWETGSFTVFNGCKRGTRFVQKPGSVTPLWTIRSGPNIYCGFRGITILCNGVPGADAMLFRARPTPDEYPHGGLWWSTIDDIEIRNVGGCGLALRGGHPSDVPGFEGAALTPHQFNTIGNLQILRTGGSKSRCLSVTGQVGQHYFHGANQFDAQAPGPGCNVCIGREFGQGDYAGFLLNGGAGQISNTAPALLTVPMTTQGGQYGVIVDTSVNVTLRDCWFESIERAVYVRDHALVDVIGCTFRNACSDRIPGGQNVGKGYGVCNDTSQVSIKGCSFLGAIDTMDTGSGAIVGITPAGWGAIENNSMPGGVVNRTIGITLQAPIDRGGVYIGANRTVLVNGGAAPSMPIVMNHLFCDLFPNERATLMALNGPIRILPDGNLTLPGGKPIRLRAGDSVDVVRIDLGGNFLIQSQGRPLTASEQPAPGEMSPGEVCINEAAVVVGQSYLAGWKCLADASIVPFYESVVA